MKSNIRKRGISLIVLIITIIVMIILATVIITSISDSNIINKASLAKKNYDLSSMKEAVNTALSQVILDNKGQTEYINANDIMNKMVKLGVTEEQLDDYYISYIDGKPEVEEAPMLELTEQEAKKLGWYLEDNGEGGYALYYSLYWDFESGECSFPEGEKIFPDEIVVPYKIGNNVISSVATDFISIGEYTGKIQEKIANGENININNIKQDITIKYSKGISAISQGQYYYEIVDENGQNPINLYSLNEIMPNTVKYINTRRLNSIPNRTETLALDADNAIKSITLPFNIKSIDVHVFVKKINLTEGLEEIKDLPCTEEINIPASVTKINSMNIKNVFLKRLSIEIGNQEIADQKISSTAFANCTALETIDIPYELLSLFSPIINGVKNIKLKTAPQTIDSKCGAKLKGYETIQLPDGVTTIGDQAFHCCRGLQSITIPNSVTSIGDLAFSASDLDNIVIPNSVSTIGVRAFNGCTNLKNIQLPNGLKRIEEETFTSCYNLENIVLPNSITYIGLYAFYGCYNLKNIQLPNGLKRIEEGTFVSCDNLENIVLPNSITYIGPYAFYGPTKITVGNENVKKLVEDSEYDGIIIVDGSVN